MRLATSEFRKLRQGKLGQRVRDGGNGQGEQDIIDVEARIMVAEPFDLQIADRFDDGFRKQQDLIGNAGEFLEGVEDHGRGRAKKRRSLSSEDFPLVGLHGGSGRFGDSSLLQTGGDTGAF